jgi:hypothetical protein
MWTEGDGVRSEDGGGQEGGNKVVSLEGFP